VTVTYPSGYVFSVRLAAAGVTTMTSFTTDDGSGTGGTAIDAPPGTKLLVAQFVFTNSSDRPEPLMVPFTLPNEITGYQITLAVPVADESAFGIDPSSASQACTTDTASAMGAGAIAPPSGYCYLSAQVGAYSPAQTDVTQPPQIAPGAVGTITLVVSAAASANGIPENAPVTAVRAFAEPGEACGCWSALD
jgi:hypothetical protein